MEELLDLKGSKLKLEGNEKLQKEVSKAIDDKVEALKKDRSERKTIYQKRRDFYAGDQGSYSNITGLIKDTKQKKGHTNQVVNYAGKTSVKITYGIANNPPKITMIPLSINDKTEVIRTQAVQDYIDSVLDSRINRFWKKTYRKAAFNQTVVGDGAIRTLVVDNDIRIVSHDDMSTVMVGWNGLDSQEFDCVLSETMMTPDAVEEQFGIKVNRKLVPEVKHDDTLGDWDSNQWATKGTRSGTSELPSGKTNLSKLKVTDYDSLDYYAIKIEGELVELIIKDDINFPRLKFWTIVPNIPNLPSPWSIADIDYLIDAQLELNDNDNRTSDYIRVGGVQRYVAYNMSSFNPEDIKSSSGQVIFVTDPDGKSKFEPLQTNINNFPADQYNQRKLAQIYDMGLPKVNYGSSGADSGRSKALDYQSSIDLTIFKRDSWELAIQDIIEKIQILGHYLHPELDWFNDVDGNFVVRNAEFDWTDILPVSTSDKIVNIANKVNMLGLPLKQAYKELGYRNPDAMLQELKNELKDPDLMIFRAKMWQFSQGILMAQNQASTMAQTTGEPAVNEPSTMLNAEQSGPKPMASSQGTTAYSSMQGMVARARQNTQAKGG